MGIDFLRVAPHLEGILHSNPLGDVMTSGFTFFGVQNTDMGMGETRAAWFDGQSPVWEKDGKLYLFYTDDAGSADGPHPMGLSLDHGVATTGGQYLFVYLVLHWARHDDHVLQKLDGTDTAPYGLTRNMLLACEVASEHCQGRSNLSMRMVRIRTREHPDMRFLADPDKVDPEKTEYWGAWGMPNGQVMVGPQRLIMKQLDGLRRESWHNLNDYQRMTLVTTLLRHPDYRDELPRDIRVEGLRAQYRWLRKMGRSDWSARNARNNAESWARMYFKLEDDPMGMPWV